MNKPILEFSHVTHGYDHKVVLNDLNFKVTPGEFITIVGPSGCGKSTLIRLILGAEKPVKGKILVDGKEKREPSKDCNIVYQKYSVFPHLTVLDNVVMNPILEKTEIRNRFLAKIGLDRTTNKLIKTLKVKARTILRKVGLEESMNKYPYQLSGGMQQRLAIAQSLIMKPKILLFDEPFSALDLWVKNELENYIEEIWRDEKITFFFITHDLREASLLCTRLLVLSPYWCDENGHNGGAKIVMDLKVPSYWEERAMAKNEQLKIDDDIATRIMNLGVFDKTHKLPIKEFIFEHPDSIKEIK